MGIVPALDQRHLTPELMDDPGLEPAQHRQALRGLSRLNWVSRADRLLWEPIRELAAVPGHPPLRALDLATGSGDLPIALARRARRAGLALTIHGCDNSSTAVEEAQARAAAGVEGVEFFRLDALHDLLPGDYDVIMCSLFMHHLEEEQVIELLYRMRSAARRMVLVSDLRRCRGGYVLAGIASRLLTRSRIVHVDALKSVRAAYSVDEFAALAAEAGLERATLECRWPCRFVLRWVRE